MDKRVLDFYITLCMLWTGWGRYDSSSNSCVDEWCGIMEISCLYIEEESVYYVSEINLLKPNHLLPSLPKKLTKMKHLKLLLTLSAI